MIFLFFKIIYNIGKTKRCNKYKTDLDELLIQFGKESSEYNIFV